MPERQNLEQRVDVPEEVAAASYPDALQGYGAQPNGEATPVCAASSASSATVAAALRFAAARLRSPRARIASTPGTRSLERIRVAKRFWWAARRRILQMP